MVITRNHWLGLAYKWLLPLALVAAIGVATVTVISARSGDGDCDGGKGHGKFGARVSELAELVGADPDELKSALREGQTMAQIAEANGVDPQSVIDALVEKANARIDAAVEAGKLTAEAAEAKKSEAATKIEDAVNNGVDRQKWGNGAWRGRFGKLGKIDAASVEHG